MATALEYALLSANVYGNSYRVRHEQNTLPIPDGWTDLKPGLVLSDGFMATAYQRGNEVVVSYAGTTDENQLDWLTGNVPAATAGWLADQVIDAAKFYLDVLAAHAGASISFTGHSLGGGLASLMAVYFDRHATVFDEAPFQKSADSLGIVTALQANLLVHGYSLPAAFLSYVALDPTGAVIPSPTRWARQGNVDQISTNGEVLSLASTALTNYLSVALGVLNPALWVLGTGVDKIRGSQTIIDPKAQTMLGWGPLVPGTQTPILGVSGNPVDLHSISLLASFFESPQFLATVQVHPELLPRLFAGLFKNINPKSDQANPLDMLVQREYRGEGSLGALATDVDKIDLVNGLTSVTQLPTRSGVPTKINVASLLVDAVLTNLYSQGKDRDPSQTGLPQFQTALRNATGGLMVDLSEFSTGADAVGQELAGLLDALIGEGSVGAATSKQVRWTLQSGSAALQAIQTTDGRADVMLGYTGDDAMDGGAGDDVLVGYGGADTLKGGAGIDFLYGGDGNDILDGGDNADWLTGGAGTDTYQFNGNFGVDTIEDSDASGLIQVDGVQLRGGAQIAPGLYQDVATGWTYGVSNSNLVIHKDGSLDQITVRNWQPGQLGINFGGPVSPPVTQINQTYYVENDPRPDIGGSLDLTESRYDQQLSYQVIGTLDDDSIVSALGDDELIGGGGSDFLRSLDGDDRLYGGDVHTVEEAIALADTPRVVIDEVDQLEGLYGNDLLIGGLYNNRLAGGDGKDTIVGGSGEDFVGGDGLATLRLLRPFDQVFDYSANGKYMSYAVEHFDDGSDKYWSKDPWDAVNGATDAIFTGLGDDIVDAGPGDDLVSLGGDNDIGVGWSGSDTVDGAAGDDLIFGDFNWDPSTPGPEVLPELYLSYAGLDAHLHGNDILDGGDGNDEIWGNGGADEIYGGAGNDTLRGDDFITPGEFHGSDYLDGGDGADDLVGGGRGDELFGGSGDDKLWGDVRQTSDIIVGSLSADYQGEDYLDGEDGADQLVGGGKGDTLYGGNGNDSLFGDGDTSYLPGDAHGDDYLDGEDGTDYLQGDGGADTLYGGAGNDTLRGDAEGLDVSFHGQDYLDGEDGDDLLVGGGNADTLYGGVGDDRLFGDDDPGVLDSSAHGDDYLDGQEGDDYLEGGGSSDTLVGGDGKDTLRGDSANATLPALANGDDYLKGEAGADTLVGGGGNDYLDGGDDADLLRGDDDPDVLAVSAHGNDTLVGGAGNDSLLGGGGDDFLEGGEGSDWLSGEDETTVSALSQLTGNDALYGDAGADTLVGGNGNDYLDGGEDSDYLSGGAGADTLVGGGGYDELDGGSGSDELDGGGGTDYLKGGAGDDLYTLRSGESPLNELGEAEALDDTEGRNTVRFSGVSLADVRVSGSGPNSLVIDYSTTDRVIVAKGVIGSDTTYEFDGGDRYSTAELIGNVAVGIVAAIDDQGNQHLLAGRGDDTLVANADHATLSGGRGNDTLIGSGGNNTYLYSLGDGSDAIQDSSAKNRAGPSAPNRIVFGSGISSADLSITMVGGVVRVQVGADPLDSISLYDPNIGTAEAASPIDQFVFADGTLSSFEELVARGSGGTAAADNITGTSLGDRISGYLGDDTIFGLAGDDTLDGGADNDFLFGGSGADSLIGGTGSDTLKGGDGNDYLQGNEGNDYMWGEVGDDTLDGGAGNDTLFGGVDLLGCSPGDAGRGELGNDVLRGGFGNDQLSAGAGNDTLDGGAGDDALAGGDGADVYLFGRGSGQDTIDNSDSAPPGTSHDYIQLGSGITPADVALSRSGSVLVLRLAGSDDTLTIGGYAGLDFIKFADGATWDQAAIQPRLLVATNGDDELNGSAANDVINAGDGNDTIVGAAGDDVLGGESANDKLDGGDGNDSLDGGPGEDRLDGGLGTDFLTGAAGGDSLNGGAGNDTLDGGAGTDSLSGGDGADTYAFGRGSGQDRISNADADSPGVNADSIQLGTGIATSDVVLARVGDDLVLSINGTDDRLLIGGYFLADGSSSSAVESIRFADATTWGVAAVKSRVPVGSGGDDTLKGYAGSDTIDGGDGNDIVFGQAGADVLYGGTGKDNLKGEDGTDTLIGGAGNDFLFGANDNDNLQGNEHDDYLYGDAGNDLLDGGTGNDTLYGGDGSDVYLFGKGSGQDYIVNYDADAIGVNPDTVELGAGVTPAGLTLTRSGNNLVLAINGTDDQFLVQNYFSQGGNSNEGLEFIKFADSTIWNYAAVSSRISTAAPPAGIVVTGTGANETLAGGLGNDTVYGNAGNDTLDGGAGSDTLDGGSGNDTYLFGKGSGKDTINGYDATVGKIDTVQIGAGVLTGDIAVARIGDDLILSIKGTSDSLRIGSYFASDGTGGYQVEQIRFADSTIWNVAAVKVRAIAATADNDALTGYATDDAIDGGVGDDTLYGRLGNDTLGGSAGEDRIYGEEGNDALRGGTQNDTLYGGDGSDDIQGQEGNDQLFGQAGNDILDGGAGDDLLDSGAGNDTYLFGRGSGHDTISAYDGTAGKIDVLQMGAGVTASDIALSRNGDILILAIKGTADSISVNDYFRLDGTFGSQIEQIRFADSTVWSVAAVKSIVVTPSEGADAIWGYATGDSISGAGGNDTIHGQAGDDTLDGGAGADLLYGEDGNNLLRGGLQSDTLLGGNGNDVLSGDDGADDLRGGGGDDALQGGGGGDDLFGQDGADVLYGGDGDDYFEAGPGNDTMDGGAGDDVYAMFTGSGADVVDSYDGNTGKVDAIELPFGVRTTDVSLRRDGDSLVLSLKGYADTLTVDNFFLDNATSGYQIEEIRFWDQTVWDIATIKDRVLDHAPSLLNPLQDQTVNRGATFHFGVPADALVDPDTGDTLTFAATLADGTPLPDWLIFDPVTRGFSGTVPETAQAKTSIKVIAKDGTGFATGAEFDFVVPVGGTASQVPFNAIALRNQTITQGGAVNFSLPAAAFIDPDPDDALTYTATRVDGSALPAWLSFNPVTRNFTGTFSSSGTTNIKVNVRDGGGLVSSGTFLLQDSQDLLLRPENDGTRTGFGGPDLIDGFGGSFTLAGNLGNDAYIVNDRGDVVVERANEGIDTVQSSVGYTLPSNVENLVLTGDLSVNAAGNTLANQLTGNAGSNILDGGLGADTMQGGAGDDIYVVDDTRDVVVETGADDVDTVVSSVVWTLAPSLENLTLTGTASVAGSGNASDNILIGNSGANVLSGYSGNDTIIGGTGNDLLDGGDGSNWYVFARGDGQDTILAAPAGAAAGSRNSVDLVNLSPGNITLRRVGADLEIGIAGTLDKLTVRSFYLNDNPYNTSNPLQQLRFSTEVWDIAKIAQVIGGGSGNARFGTPGPDLLSAAGPSATLIGGAGADTYVVDDAGDAIFELVGEGTDAVQSSITYALGANVENLVLTGVAAIGATGNALANVLTGNAAANVLDGGGGPDAMAGGSGDDTYVAGESADTVTENAGEGTDTVQASISYVLGDNLENLQLTGQLDLNATGNGSDNVLVGNSGNNLLDGAAGADSMSGGLGDDTYFVDNAGDGTTELSGQGIDSTFASITWMLVADVENLTLTGLGNSNATGNALANVLTGNAGSNRLDGAGGNDTLDGGAGNDTLDGGAGNDVYLFGRGYGSDTIDSIDTGVGKLDTLQLKAGLSASDVVLTRDGNDLVLAIAGTTDTLRVKNHFSGGAAAGYQIEQIRFADGTAWGIAAIQSLVTVNRAPTLAIALPDRTIVQGTTATLALPVGSFADVDAGEVLTYAAALSSGGALPAWLSFDAVAHAFTGNTAGVALGTTSVKVTVTDRGGLTASDVFDVTVRPVNQSPTVAVPLSDQSVVRGGAVNFNVPAAAFVDPDAGDVLGYSATLQDGSPLPVWLSFDPATRTFGGSTALAPVGVNSIKVTATDGGGLSASDQFDLVIRSSGLPGNTLYGTPGNDYLYASNGNDTIYGAAGDDWLVGGLGDNAIWGEAGNDYLLGQGGSDTLTGGSGDDIYSVDSIDDVVVEAAGEGFDLVQATLNWTLGANVETLYVGGAATSGTGNALNNYLYTDSYSNLAVTLDGGAGADTLQGGLGNDTYIVDNAADRILEYDGGTLNGVPYVNTGVDSARASVSYTLGANVENLVLTGTAVIDGDGNGMANMLTGNGAANRLDGWGGLDTLIGGDGDDTYVVHSASDTVVEVSQGGNDTVVSSSSWTLGAELENLTLTGSLAIDATGNAAPNVLRGNDASNVLDGRLGADTMAGAKGDDLYSVDDGGDQVLENANEGVDTVRSSVTWALSSNVENLALTGVAEVNATGNSAANALLGNSAANVLLGAAGNDTLDGGSGADTMAGGVGDDAYVVESVGDVVTEGVDEGVDTVEASIDYVAGAHVENVTLTGGRGLVVTGNALANTLRGNSAANRLDGAAGADTLVGGDGDDVYVVDDSGDTVSESVNEGIDSVEASVGYLLAANLESLTLVGGSAIDGAGNGLDNVVRGNVGDNVLDGGAGADVLIGGGGNDTYVVDSLADVVTENAGEGLDLVRASVSYVLGANLESLALAGAAAIDGTGNALANAIVGNSAANTIDGQAGADTMSGGAGNDTYVVDSAGDVVIESTGEGTDTVQASVSYALGADVENLTLIGTGSVDATGNVLANVLTGNAGNNVLDGGSGADTMTGGSGNDTYIVDNVADFVVEAASAGADTVQSGVSYTLGANVEILTLTGVASLNATGNTLANVLTGNAGANVLDGGSAADNMAGGLGDDTYVIDNLGDTVTEAAGAGVDLVQSSISYSLGTNLENLTLVGAGAVNAAGNSVDNVLTGNAAANALDGALGADTMAGGLGNDTYIVENPGDVVVEGVNEGVDAVQSSITYTLGANVENLTLTGVAALNGTGNALANVLTGNSSDNILDGGAGADRMTGGLGNDTYVVDNTADVVTEAASAGTDSVRASVTSTLGAYVENLTLTGSASINGIGNTAVNAIIGNAGDNRLDGGAGADSMSGGAGNDTYVVDNAADLVTELAGGGIDRVESTIAYVLGAEVENLLLTGAAAINGTGNSVANTLTGNSGDNVLDGGAGADAMAGGAGNDTYIVDNVADIVTEAASAGTDLVKASVGYALGANVENLLLTGAAAINGTGNTLANALTGNSGDNLLDGGTGVDNLVGGLGNDTYVIDNIGDVVTEAASAGTDLIQSSITYTLGANLENLRLTGSAAINGTGNAVVNVITGNSGVNRIDGGAGADTMIGGAGNDTYVVDAVGDVVTELAAGGIDTVQSSIGYALGNEVENLTLTGAGTINGTGNAAANIIIGNTGVNRIDGGLGADSMTGGAGNDTYVVGVAGDVITELASGGTDTVESGISWTLGAELENLTLTGAGSINGTGNTLNNTLTGNAAANVLTGSAGNDTLDGGAGADTLAGGTGNDTYVIGRGYGAELVQENDATVGNTDAAQFLSGIATDQIWFRHLGNDLEVSIIGTSDKGTLQNWYLGSQYHLEQFKTSDGKMLLDSRVQSLVDAMAAFAPPSAGQTTLPPAYQAVLNPIIGANWGP